MRGDAAHREFTKRACARHVARRGARPSESPELDTPCGLCDAKGRRGRAVCLDCDGSGYVLTPEGAALIDFLRRHRAALGLPSDP